MESGNNDTNFFSSTSSIIQEIQTLISLVIDETHAQEEAAKHIQAYTDKVQKLRFLLQQKIKEISEFPARGNFLVEQECLSNIKICNL
jgi:uncharacterized protein YyaL (SSP411 family)